MTGPASTPSGREGVTAAQVREARRDLGRQLAARRDTAGLSHADLAARVHCAASTVATVEKGRKHAPLRFWEAADRALGANGLLVKAFAHVELLAEDHDRLVELAERGERDDEAEPGVTVVCRCRQTVARWASREVRALRVAMRLPVRAFAEFLGVAVATVTGWEHKRAGRPLHLSTQELLDRALKLADADVRSRFWQLLHEAETAG